MIAAVSTRIRKNSSWKASRRQADAANVYQVIVKRSEDGSASYVGTDLNKSGTATILRSSENRFSDNVEFHSKSKADLRSAKGMKNVVAVVRKPVPKAMGFEAELAGVRAYFPLLEESCSAEQTAAQATKIDTTGQPEVENKGFGCLCIAWDFIPREDLDRKDQELLDRPGGALKIYRNNSQSIDVHGCMVSGAIGGRNAGLASGSQLVLLGLSEDVTDDLSAIEQLAEMFKGPVVVNMSFGLEFFDLESEEEVQGVRDYIEYLDGIMRGMMERHPRLLFLVAAGNETQDMCESTEPISYGSARNIMYWPQFALKKPRPFIQVGATRVQAPEPHRLAAIYSNFGSCVEWFAHGGDMCLWDVKDKQFVAVQGTSFASPLAASVAALMFAQDRSRTAADVRRMLAEACDASVQALPSASTTNLFLRLPTEVANFKQDAPPSLVPLPETLGATTIEEDLDTPWFAIALTVAAVAAGLAAALYLRKKSGVSRKAHATPRRAAPPGRAHTK